MDVEQDRSALDDDEEEDNQAQHQQQIFTCTSSSSSSSSLKQDDDHTSNSQTSSYFESLSSSSDTNDHLLFPNANEDNQQVLNRLYHDNTMNFLFDQSQKYQSGADPTVLQQNSEALHRQEHGGVVVYDSCARMIGNTILQSYYENNPPTKINFNLLFGKDEVAKADKLFHKVPRERDFTCDFDKFIFKHLPKFQPERQYGGINNNYQQQQQYTINVPQQENILIFDSRFENGNLKRAIKVNNVEYNLLLENDVNTKGHTQWFYFKVVHQYRKKQKIQFNILNLAKPHSLYSEGMKPCIFSRKQNEQSGRGWFRGGEEIKYFQNQIPRKVINEGTGQGNHNNSFLYNNNGAGEGLEYHFTLSFIYQFEEDEDDVWFAHAIPYTFTDLQVNLKSLVNKHENREMLKTNILCKTLAGTPCPLITITDKIHSYMDYYDELELNKHLPNVIKKQLQKKYRKCKKLYKQSKESQGKVKKLLKAAFDEEINTFCQKNIQEFKKIDQRFGNIQQMFTTYIQDHFHKKAIIITSRVHPGEPQSSYMLQGTIDYLLSDQAKELRRYFVFRIVPMLNVDGVIYGNYRCSLLGVDLNRKWIQPNVFLHPEIFYAKQLVKSMHNERRVLMYCDLHGHSRKQNAFFYACTYKNFEHEGRIKNAQLRIIPLLCCHRNDAFKFKDCRFKIEKCKESTARVVVFREFNIMNSFTLECSFYGKEETIDENSTVRSSKHRKFQHFGIKDFMSIGMQLAQVLDNYLPTEQQKLNLLSGKILEIFYDEFIKFIPPYVLKREEERKKQMLQDNQPTSQDVLQSQTIGKNTVGLKYLISNQSPKHLDNKQSQSVALQLHRSPSFKKQRKSFYNGNNQVANQVINQSKRELIDLTPISLSLRKQKPDNIPQVPVKKSKKNQKRKQKSPTNRKVSNSDCQSQFSIVKTCRHEQLSEAESFSQMINIHANQDEIMDLELFIKEIKEQVKIASKFTNENQSDDGNGTDSSDSEESVKNIFVRHKQSSMNNGNGKEKIHKKRTLKKVIEVNKEQNVKQEQSDSNKMMKSMGSHGSYQKRPKRKMTITKPLFNHQLLSIEGQKQIAMGILDSKKLVSSGTTLEKQNQPTDFLEKSYFIKQQNVNESLHSEALIFDKIPHRKESSPSMRTKEEVNDEFKMINSDNLQSRNQNTLTIRSEQKATKNDNREDLDQSAMIFKSYEELKQPNTIEKQRIFPLYENPLYHQNRLTTSSNVLSGNNNLDVQSVNTSLAQTTQQASQPFNLKNLSGTQYEPYEEQRNINKNTNHLLIKQTYIQQESKSINLRPKQKSGVLNKLMISPMMSAESTQVIKNASSNPNQTARPQDIYSNRTFYQKNVYQNQTVTQQNLNNQSGSLQRLSFKELLESSRQARIKEKQLLLEKSQQQQRLQTSENKSSTNNNPVNHGHLLQMLKSTYQRFQQKSILSQVQASKRYEGIDGDRITPIKATNKSSLESNSNHYFHNSKSFIGERRSQQKQDLQITASASSREHRNDIVNLMARFNSTSQNQRVKCLQQTDPNYDQGVNKSIMNKHQAISNTSMLGVLPQNSSSIERIPPTKQQINNQPDKRFNHLRNMEQNAMNNELYTPSRQIKITGLNYALKNSKDQNQHGDRISDNTNGGLSLCVGKYLPPTRSFFVQRQINLPSGSSQKRKRKNK